MPSIDETASSICNTMTRGNTGALSFFSHSFSAHHNLDYLKYTSKLSSTTVSDFSISCSSLHNPWPLSSRRWPLPSNVSPSHHTLWFSTYSNRPSSVPFIFAQCPTNRTWWMLYLLYWMAEEHRYPLRFKAAWKHSGRKSIPLAYVSQQTFIKCPLLRCF